MPNHTGSNLARSFTHKLRSTRGAVRYTTMFSNIRRSFLLGSLLIVGAVTVPSSGHAQSLRGAEQVLADSTRTAESLVVADAGVGPRVVQAGILTHERVGAPLVPQPRDQVRAGSNLALMGVGVTALILGLVIGDDAGTVIAIGGGAIGLVGLYRYLR